ncbi:MAG: hypothetical protein R3B90_22055 [Planctomycetaceae bacterium]
MVPQACLDRSGHSRRARAVAGFRRESPRFDRLQGTRHFAARLVKPELDGNLVFFGGDYQLFVPWVRLLDPSREVHVLKGDDLLRESRSLERALHDYRARYVCVDSHTPAGDLFRREVGHHHPESLVFIEHYSFDNGHKLFEIDLYAYQGPVAEEMAHVPLRSSVHNAAAE